MITSFLLLAVLPLQGAGPGTDRTVSFTSPVARVENVLPQLGKVSGLQLTASVNLRDLLLTVVAPNVQEKALFQRIAEAANAEWQRTETGWRLARSINQSQRAERERQALLSERLKISLESRRVTLSKYSEFNLATARSVSDRLRDPSDGNVLATEQLKLQLPLGRALTRILANFDVKELTKLPLNQSSSFSTQPNASQRPLGESGRKTLQQLIAEEGVLRQVSEGDVMDQRFSDAPTAKLVLWVYPVGTGQFTLVRLYGVDRSGYGTGVAEDAITLGDEGGNSLLVMLDQKKNGPKAATEPKFSADTRFLAENGTGTLVDRERAWKLLNDPMKREPLSFGTSEIAEWWAGERKRPLVATFTDLTAFAGLVVARKDFNVAQWFGAYRLFGGQQRVSADGWEIWTAFDEERARALRADRAAIATLARVSYNGGNASLEDLCAAVAPLPLPEFSPPVELVNRFLHSVSDSRVTSVDQLYGALTPAQRRQALQGGLPVSELGELAKLRLVSWIYGSVNVLKRPSVGTPEAPEEVTERLPGGLTGKEVLSLSDASNNVFTVSSDGRRYWAEVSAEITQILSSPEEGGLPPVSQWRYSFYRQRTITLNLTTAGGYTANETIRGKVGKVTEPLPLEQLEPAQREHVRKCLIASKLIPPG